MGEINYSGVGLSLPKRQEHTVAIMMILEWQDVSVDAYERVNDAMGIRSDADAPEGLIEHVAALTEDDELVIVDLWESAEALDRFVQTRLGPAIERLELPQSEARIAEVHNHRAGAAGEGNVLILVEVPDASTDDYDAMARSMPSHADDGHQPWHLHTAATDGENVVVVDMWASEEAFGQFAQDEIVPAAQQAGVTGIDHRALRVHNRIRGRATVTP